MKHIFSIIVFAVFLCVLTLGCHSGRIGSLPSQDETIGKDASYALGMNIGSSMQSDGLYPNIQEFAQGIIDILSNNPTRSTMDEASEVFFVAYNELRERQDMENRQTEGDFLEENSRNPGIMITPSGLQYEVIQEGSGETPSFEDTVRVHYEGSLVDGTVFDSSYMRGEPIEFPLSGVIPGWTEGLQLMNVGSTYRLFIPSDLGYGPQGAPPLIPPYSALIFQVELLDIIR